MASLKELKSCLSFQNYFIFPKTFQDLYTIYVISVIEKAALGVKIFHYFKFFQKGIFLSYNKNVWCECDSSFNSCWISYTIAIKYIVSEQIVAFYMYRKTASVLNITLLHYYYYCINLI